MIHVHRMPCTCCRCGHVMSLDVIYIEMARTDGQICGASIKMKGGRDGKSAKKEITLCSCSK